MRYPPFSETAAAVRGLGNSQRTREAANMLTPAKASDLGSHVPFDADRLDRLMDEAGLDVLIATSKHNIQYLLGGHRSFFFDNMDAIGISRYLPAFVYPKGAPDKAAYFGHGMETYQTQLKPFWVAEVNTKSGG